MVEDTWGVTSELVGTYLQRDLRVGLPSARKGAGGRVMGGMDAGVWGSAATGGVAVGSGEGAGKHRGWCKRWVDDGGGLPAPNEQWEGVSK